MANGDSAWHADIPGWAKTFAFLIGTVGAPIVVASFFMAQSAGIIPSIGGRNTARLDTMITNQNSIITEVREDRREGKELLQKLTTALRIMCKNSASGPREASNCEAIQ